jgi:hypothetical protein
MWAPPHHLGLEHGVYRLNHDAEGVVPDRSHSAVTTNALSQKPLNISIQHIRSLNLSRIPKCNSYPQETDVLACTIMERAIPRLLTNDPRTIHIRFTCKPKTSKAGYYIRTQGISRKRTDEAGPNANKCFPQNWGQPNLRVTQKNCIYVYSALLPDVARGQGPEHQCHQSVRAPRHTYPGLSYRGVTRSPAVADLYSLTEAWCGSPPAPQGPTQTLSNRYGKVAIIFKHLHFAGGCSVVI